MPLIWNIENTEMGKIRESNPKSDSNCDDVFICALGMSILNELGEGYTPTLRLFELDEKTMLKLKGEWIEDAKKQKFSKLQIEQIKDWMPKLVGMKCRRNG